MPRSLSSRCHRAASGNLFTTSALWWSCTLQMPIAFCWRSLQRHQLLKPCSNKAPFPCHGGEGEAERVTSRSLKARGQEGEVRVSRLLRLAAGLPSWSPGSIDPGGDGHILHTSCQPGPNHWNAAGRSTCQFISPVGDRAMAKEESEGKDEAMSRWMHEAQKSCLYFHCNEYCLFRSYTA